jgi:hypothetical protein
MLYLYRTAYAYLLTHKFLRISRVTIATPSSIYNATSAHTLKIIQIVIEMDSEIFRSIIGSFQFVPAAYFLIFFGQNWSNG